ncbi:MAG: hypothetical protein HC886_12055 [Leptolyngbyaceae cyanobacterium SM1_1_3]|nr:hypothetical protein [Leptolyngbyaceae cyanobacterium SM1_1_3]NJO10727.1 hypothetical protein [Leptolyngbyaceae cyanobacterium SL_1_1]
MYQSSEPTSEATFASNSEPASGLASEASSEPKPGPETPSSAAAQPSRSRDPKRKDVRHILLGEADAVHLDILSMHVLGYAEATAWSRPQPTGKPNEVVRVLIKTQLVE